MWTWTSQACSAIWLWLLFPILLCRHVTFLSAGTQWINANCVQQVFFTLQSALIPFSLQFPHDILLLFGAQSLLLWHLLSFKWAHYNEVLLCLIQCQKFPNIHIGPLVAQASATCIEGKRERTCLLHMRCDFGEACHISWAHKKCAPRIRCNEHVPMSLNLYQKVAYLLDLSTASQHLFLLPAVGHNSKPPPGKKLCRES